MRHDEMYINRFVNGENISMDINTYLSSFDELIINRIMKYTSTINGCWIWNGTRTKKGYGIFSLNNKQHRIHRFLYKSYFGDFDSKLEVNHKCLNKACFNPNHLELLTSQQHHAISNTPIDLNRRKTHCIKGHEFTSENIRLRHGKFRECRTCRRLDSKKYYQKKKSLLSNKL